MQVEDVARVSLASRRAAQRQRHLTIGHSLLGQIIVDDKHVTARVLGAGRLAVLSVVDEVLAHSGASHRGNVLQRRGIGSGSVDDDGVLHRAVLLQRFLHVGHRGGLLTHGDVDADHVLALLVQDCVNGDGGLTSLTVADDQLALTTTDRNHGVDGQNAGLHGLMHGLAVDNARSLELNGARTLGLDLTLAVQRHTQRIHHAAKQGLAGGNLHQTTGGLHRVVFLDCCDVTEQHGADFVLFEVLSHTVDDLAGGAGELEEFACHRILQAINASNTVADLDDGSHFAGFDTGVQRVELLAQRLVDRLCGDFSH